jgi:hypothetical protein
MHIRITHLPIVAALAGITMAIQAGTSHTPSNGSRTPRVYLVYGSEGRFDDLVEQHFPGLTSSPQYPLIRSTSVLAIDDDAPRIKAMTIKWTILNQDGTSTTRFSVLFPDPQGRSVVPGTLDVAVPGGAALVSPVVHEQEIPAGSAAARVAHLDAVYSQPDVVSPLLTARSVEAKIDGIVFGNGVFVGKDEFGLLAKYTCERNGAIDEALSLLSALGDSQGTYALLTRDFVRSKQPQDPTAADLPCAEARGREAARLLYLFEHRGETTFDAVVSQISAQRRANLQIGLPGFHGSATTVHQ